MFSAWCCLGAAHVDLAELGHAVDELRDLVTEEAAHLLAGDLGVLDGVVEQRGHQRLGVEPQVGQDARDGEGMLDVGLAGEPGLPVWARSATSKARRIAV